ncbi:hypothetical protein QTP88_029735 [Uroleucon formosanum]
MDNTTSSKISNSKRSLQSSPNSPIQKGGKKTKSFVSPNKFAVLANKENNEIQLDTSYDTSNITNKSTHHHQQDNIRALSICVQNITNYSAFENTLVQITGPNGFSCKFTSSFLMIQPRGRKMFNLIAIHLKDTSASFHTFIPPTYQPYKVIIRNLYHTTLISDISDALSELVLSARRVTNVIKNGHPCPLFLVELNLNTDNKNILNLSSILHTKIKVELPYKTKSGLPQCRNCQNYGHTANYCHHPSRLNVGVIITPKFAPKIKPVRTILTFRYLQTPSLPPKASYASVTDSKNIPLPNIHANDKPLTKFISELSSLITPLITLFKLL